MAKKEEKELARKEGEELAPFSPFDEMERRLEDFLRRPFSLLGPPWWPARRLAEAGIVSPRVDIFEEADNVVVKAELPGMKKEDIAVNLTDNTVTISGEKKKEEKVEKKDFYRLERSFGSFSRSFSLPSEVDTSKAKAQFRDGVLEVKVPKTEEAKKKEKKIPIE